MASASWEMSLPGLSHVVMVLVRKSLFSYPWICTGWLWRYCDEFGGLTFVMCDENYLHVFQVLSYDPIWGRLSINNNHRKGIMAELPILQTRQKPPGPWGREVAYFLTTQWWISITAGLCQIQIGNPQRRNTFYPITHAWNDLFPWRLAS